MIEYIYNAIASFTYINFLFFTTTVCLITTIIYQIRKLRSRNVDMLFMTTNLVSLRTKVEIRHAGHGIFI